MRLIVIVGRTCSGKTTLSARLAAYLDFSLLSVGGEIRAAMQSNAALKASYLGRNGFSNAQIAEIVLAAVHRIKPVRGLVIEGSLGLGPAVRMLLSSGKAFEPITFVVNCPRNIRLARYLKRNDGKSRVEHEQFFQDREVLFDNRLSSDIIDLNEITNLYNVDGSRLVDDVFKNAKSHIDNS